MRNKSEELPALPPSYSWRVIKGQAQAWWKGSAQFWDRDPNAVAARAWNKWTQDSGLTQERHLYLLRCERIVSQI